MYLKKFEINSNEIMDIIEHKENIFKEIPELSSINLLKNNELLERSVNNERVILNKLLEVIS